MYRLHAVENPLLGRELDDAVKHDHRVFAGRGAHQDDVELGEVDCGNGRVSRALVAYIES